jgi:hypothetical protein
MPCVGFEPTIPATERAKTVHASYRAATVTVLYENACTVLQGKPNYFPLVFYVINTVFIMINNY